MAKKEIFYGASIDHLYRIESIIFDYDVASQGDFGIELTDGNVKSALRKTMGFIAGKTPGLPEDKPRERCIADLTCALVSACQLLIEADGASKEQVNVALLAVEDSLKTRRGYHGGTRGYLNYLLGFMPQAKLARGE